jgi:hypothetical protein
MAELEVPKSMPSVPKGEDIMNGGCQSEGRKPGRGTHALKWHVLWTGHFATKCVNVPSLAKMKAFACATTLTKGQ